MRASSEEYEGENSNCRRSEYTGSTHLFLLFTPPLLEKLQYPAWKNTNCGTFLGLLCRAHLHLLPHLSPPSANRTTSRYLINWTICISRNSELRHRDISREPHCKIKTSCVGTKANQSLVQTKGMGKQKPRTWKKKSVWRSRNRHYRVTETQDTCHGFPEKNWLVNCLKIFWFPERWAGLQTPSVWQMPFLSKLIQMVSVSCSQIILKTLKEVK